MDNIEKKIDEIISNLTLEEKVFQMGMMQSRMFCDENEKFSKEMADEIFRGYSLAAFRTPDCPPPKNLLSL